MRKYSEAGMTITSVLVGMAITTVVSLFAVNQFSNASKAQQHVDLDAEFVSLRTKIVNDFDCNQTVIAMGGDCSTASPYTWLKVMRSNGSVLIDNTGGINGSTKVGRYKLRAWCRPCSTCPNNKMIQIDAGVFKPNTTTVINDPLSGKPRTWKNLFLNVPLGCAIGP